MILRGHSDDVYSVKFSPDGKRIASGGRDRTIRFWDASTGALTHTLPGHGDSVYAVAFSPDGKLLASGCRDGTIKIWDAVRGVEKRTLTGHKIGRASCRERG